MNSIEARYVEYLLLFREWCGIEAAGEAVRQR